MERKILLDTNASLFSRNITWSQILAASSNSKDELVIQNNVKSKTETGKDLHTPIIKVIAPTLTDDVKDKVNLDNIKEQSLDKPKAKLTEPIKVLKEKILDLKGEKTEQSNFFHI